MVNIVGILVVFLVFMCLIRIIKETSLIILTNHFIMVLIIIFDLSNKLSLNLGMIISNFQSISIFSERELEEFTVFQMAMHYKIF